MTNVGLEAAPSVQSVDRALRILEVLSVSGEGGVTEIAATLQVHKSTASRLLTTLERHGFVEQVVGRGRYRLGRAIGELGPTSPSTSHSL